MGVITSSKWWAGKDSLISYYLAGKVKSKGINFVRV